MMKRLLGVGVVLLLAFVLVSCKKQMPLQPGQEVWRGDTYSEKFNGEIRFTLEKGMNAGRVVWSTKNDPILRKRGTFQGKVSGTNEGNKVVFEFSGYYVEMVAIRMHGEFEGTVVGNRMEGTWWLDSGYGIYKGKWQTTRNQ